MYWLMIDSGGGPMSSFRRHVSGGDGGGAAAVPVVKLPGTRAWVNGQTLTSTGNRDLDGIIGGGLCLGTVTLLEEDRFCNHALTVAQYFLAQGAGVGHRCLVVGAEGEEVLDQFVVSMPASIEEKKSTGTGATAPDKDSQSGSGLRIAWQYQKYLSPDSTDPSNSVSRPPVAVAAQYCLSFDLATPSTQVRSSEVALLDVATQCRQGDYAAILQALQGLIAGLPPGVVLRVVVKSFLGAGSWGAEASAAPAALHFLFALRRLIQGCPVVVMVTMPAHHIQQQQRALLYRVVDTVLSVDSFSGKSEPPPPEFRDFVGFLYIKAVQHVNALAATRAPSNKYGLKRDRRRLYIQPLHLPPEDARALTEDVEKQGARKRASKAKTALEPGMGCSSGLPGRSNPLDF